MSTLPITDVFRQVGFHARALWDYARLNPHEPCDGS